MAVIIISLKKKRKKSHTSSSSKSFTNKAIYSLHHHYYFPCVNKYTLIILIQESKTLVINSMLTLLYNQPFSVKSVLIPHISQKSATDPRKRGMGFMLRYLVIPHSLTGLIKEFKPPPLLLTVSVFSLLLPLTEKRRRLAGDPQLPQT